MKTTEKTSFVRKDLSLNQPPPEKSGHVRRGGILSSQFSVIGAGVLAYPYSYYSTGLITGIVIVLLSGYSLAVLAYASSLHDDALSYQDIIRIYLGKFWVVVSELLFIVNLSGACITYLIIIGDCITPFFIHFCGPNFYFSDRKVVIIFVSCIFIFPLILFREVRKLGVSSVFAVFGILYLTGMFIVVCTVYWTGGGEIHESVKKTIFFNTNMFEGFMPQCFIAVPIVAFSFQGIELICVPVYYELKNPSLLKMVVIIFFSLFFSVFFYFVIGTFGFLRFGENTAPNVLVSFGTDFAPSLVAMLLMGLTVTFSYPLFFFAERLALHSLIFGKSDQGTGSFFFLTLILFVTSVVPSVFVGDISDVLGIIGSFIFPMFILLKIIYQRKVMNLCVKYTLVISTVIIIILSLILLVCGNLVTILKIVHQSKSGKITLSQNVSFASIAREYDIWLIVVLFYL